MPCLNNINPKELIQQLDDLYNFMRSNNLLKLFIEDFYPFHSPMNFNCYFNIGTTNYITDYAQLIHTQMLEKAINEISLSEFLKTSFLSLGDIKCNVSDRMTRVQIEALKIVVKNPNSICFFLQKEYRTLYLYHSLLDNYYLIVIIPGLYKIGIINKLTIELTKIDYSIEKIFSTNNGPFANLVDLSDLSNLSNKPPLKNI